MNDKNWFKVIKIDDDTYAIKEDNHDEETNSFLLLDYDKALLIDTGMGVENIMDVIKPLIKNKTLLVVITHAHWDHIGSNNSFNFIMIHELEAKWLFNFPLSLKRVKEELMNTHLPFPDSFDIDSYELPTKKATVHLKGDEIIDLGHRKIKAIHTPGHSPGHLVFYEEDRKYLFSGDLIYQGELDCYYPSTEPLIYRDSIKKLLSLDVKYIFGGHHDIFIDGSFIKKVNYGFDYLYQHNELHHQNKIFNFENFSIRL